MKGDYLLLYMNYNIPLEECIFSKFQNMVSRRGDREPFQYVIGVVEFYGLSLRVKKTILIPRDETEQFVDVIISRFRKKSITSILDLRTGSGAVALALAQSFTEAHVLAIDINQDALSMASRNELNNERKNET
jgi:release factor glutamine methyltransferase